MFYKASQGTGLFTPSCTAQHPGSLALVTNDLGSPIMG